MHRYICTHTYIEIHVYREDAHSHFENNEKTGQG